MQRYIKQLSRLQSIDALIPLRDCGINITSLAKAGEVM